ncbi:MAG: hypothetical protein DRQ42_00185 [Gammaproteobacteria bacterium]|nr:MAG: hypothetical protein DRQ42_00185 [Gammaproteobacteria bacterium]
MDLEQPTAYFVHPVYWGSGFNYGRSYMSSITTALVGVEQRSLLHHYPRREIIYDVITRNQIETYHIKKYLKAYLHKTWGVPIWVYGMTLTQAASIGASTLNVGSTQWRELSALSYVLLYTDYQTYEVIQVQSFTTSQITTVTNLTSSWGIGTKVYPVLRANLSAAQEFGAKVPEVFAIKMHFIESFRGYSYT